MAAFRIYRYRLPIIDEPVVEIPGTYHLLSVGPSRDGRNELDLWAIVDPASTPVDVLLRVAGTGHPLDRGERESLRFLGSVPHADGVLILHVFEVLEYADPTPTSGPSGLRALTGGRT